MDWFKPFPLRRLLLQSNELCDGIPHGDLRPHLRRTRSVHFRCSCQSHASRREFPSSDIFAHTEVQRRSQGFTVENCELTVFKFSDNRAILPTGGRKIAKRFALLIPGPGSSDDASPAASFGSRVDQNFYIPSRRENGRRPFHGVHVDTDHVPSNRCRTALFTSATSGDVLRQTRDFIFSHVA